jgi:hypothetical protein
MMRVAILILLSTLWHTPSTAQTLTPEKPDESYGDIAAVFRDAQSPTGAVIVYNPNICSSIGLACVFFKFHEHGHVLHRHHLIPGIPPMISERDADRFAATNAPPQAVLAAWHLFRNGGSSSNWHTYGSPQARAQRLCRFARQAGKWTGPVGPQVPC